MKERTSQSGWMSKTHGFKELCLGWKKGPRTWESLWMFKATARGHCSTLPLAEPSFDARRGQETGPIWGQKKCSFMCPSFLGGRRRVQQDLSLRANPHMAPRNCLGRCIPVGPSSVHLSVVPQQRLTKSTCTLAWLRLRILGIPASRECVSH